MLDMWCLGEQKGSHGFFSLLLTTDISLWISSPGQTTSSPAAPGIFVVIEVDVRIVGRAVTNFD